MMNNENDNSSQKQCGNSTHYTHDVVLVRFLLDLSTISAFISRISVWYLGRGVEGFFGRSG